MQETKKDGAAQQWNSSQPVLTVRGRPVNPWLVLLSLVFGFFMALLDATIVNIAIPTIQTKLNTDLTTVTWVLNAYSLVFAVLLVTAGRLADQYGRKRVFMIGMVLFSLGSLFCALAEPIASVFGGSAINWLIGFRALQAVGGAGLNSVSLAIIIAVFPREKRGAAIGVWGALSGLAAAVGPVLGGFLVQNFDWRWIFFVNLPFCVIGLIMTTLFVPETREQGVSRRIDFLGILTLSAAIFCLVLAIIQGNSWGWGFSNTTTQIILGITLTFPPTITLFGLALLSGILFVIVETLQKEPIIDFKLFKAMSFTASNIAILLFGIAIQGAFLILVLYFIDALGYTQLDAAYAVIPLPLASFFVAAFAGAMSRRINPQYLGIAGLAAVAIGMFSLWTLNAQSTYWDTAWRDIILGIGMGLSFQSFPNIVLSEVPRAKLGVGSGVFNTFRQVGFVLGVAILISVFTGQITPNINTATQNSIKIVQSSTTLPPQLKEGIVNGLEKAAASGQTRSSGQRFDLTKLANNLPPQLAQQVKPELQRLSDQIANEYKTAVVDSFRASWLVAAIIALAGVVAACFARVPKRPASSEQRTGSAEEPLDASDVVIAP